MDGNRDYRGNGGGFDPWKSGQSEPSRWGPPNDRRSRERHVPVDFRDFPSASYNRSPPRGPHQRSRSPGKSNFQAWAMYAYSEGYISSYPSK